MDPRTTRQSFSRHPGSVDLSFCQLRDLDARGFKYTASLTMMSTPHHGSESHSHTQNDEVLRELCFTWNADINTPAQRHKALPGNKTCDILLDTTR